MEYNYKRLYKVKRSDLVVRRNAKIVPLAVQNEEHGIWGSGERGGSQEHARHQAAEEGEGQPFVDRKLTGQWRTISATIEGEVASLWKRLYDDIFDPYEYVLEVENEPMPLWLRLLVNFTRPITALKYSANYFWKGETSLFYNYNRAIFAMNAFFRVASLAGIIAIIVVFFGTYGITIQT